jgi:hypothetical protein
MGGEIPEGVAGVGKTVETDRERATLGSVGCAIERHVIEI